MECYLDNSATTKVCDEAAEAALKVMKEIYGNPSSLHKMGFEAETALRMAGDIFAGMLGCSRDELIFTSGGSESDNLAIIGTAMANKRRGRHLITTRIEHPAVLQAFRYLEEQGFETTYLGTDGEGIISLEELSGSVRDDTILVSMMHVNNEIGSVQPIAEAGRIIKEKNPDCLFHVDDIQGFLKLKLIPSVAKIDLLSVSGHKLHAPKGVGLLYAGKGVRLNPLILGGGQQCGLRSGTENVPGIAAFGAAAAFLNKGMDKHVRRMYELREYFISQIKDMEDIRVNGPGSLGYYGYDRVGMAAVKSDGSRADMQDERQNERFAPQIISLSVKDVRAEVLLHALEDKGIYVSAGSACSSHKRTPSATLTAVGLDKDLLEATVRLSLSVFTTREEMEYAATALHELVPALRRFVRR